MFFKDFVGGSWEREGAVALRGGLGAGEKRGKGVGRKRCSSFREFINDAESMDLVS